MAAPAPTTAKLMAIIIMLQAQIVALQNAAPATAAAPPVGAATVVFAYTPQTLGANDLINYSTKRGTTIFEHGCKLLDDKALINGFAMTPNQIFIFVKAFHRRATTMGWNQGAMQITSDAKSTSSKVMAKSMRPLSTLHVRGSASLGKSITRPVQSRIVQ
jgi:hypothetical protein